MKSGGDTTGMTEALQGYNKSVSFLFHSLSSTHLYAEAALHAHQTKRGRRPHPLGAYLHAPAPLHFPQPQSLRRNRPRAAYEADEGGREIEGSILVPSVFFTFSPMIHLNI